jgi:hypothetical protein
VEIDFVTKEVSEAIFVVSAHAAGESSPVLDLNTLDNGTHLGLLQKSGTVILSLDSLNLENGPYFIDVGVYRTDWGEPFDYIWQALSVEVVGHRRRISPRTHQWSLR